MDVPANRMLMKKRVSQTFSHPYTRLHRALRRLLHILWYGLAVVGALVAIAFGAARVLLPAVTEKKADLEAFLSRQSGYTVRITQLEGYWDGLYPGLRMHGIDVYAAGSTRAALQLAELRISLQILPLLIGRAEIQSATLTRPRLTLERVVDGRFRILGFDPIEQGDTEQNETFIAWLFDQHRLVIEDGELQWLDRRESNRPLRLTHVNLQLRNRGARHRLGLAAEFPEGICDNCSFVADISGNPFLGEPFDGEVYLRGREVDVERIPRVIRDHLPEQLRGTFSVELWSEWERSRPVSVQGDVAAAGLRLPLTGLRAPLSVKQAAARLRWSGEQNDFQLVLSDLTLALHGTPWSMGKLRFSRREQDTVLRVEHIELADVTAFVASLRLTESSEGLPYRDLATTWAALNPAGRVQDLQAQLTGALDDPEDYKLSAVVEKLALEPNGDWPGVRGVGGKVSLERDQGELKLDMRDGALAFPQLFRASLPIARASARVRWQRKDDQWTLTTEDIAVANEDIRATGRLALQLPQDATRSPRLTLKLDFRDGNGQHAARYYPVHHVSPGTLAWMEYAFAGGTVTEGSLVYDGHTRDFPFESGPGKFEIRAKVRDAVYRYLPGWQPVTDTTADVLVQGEHFLVTGHGRIGSLNVNEIVVTGVDAGAVQVKANVSGPIAESLRVLQDVKTTSGQDSWKAWLPSGLEAAGNGVLSLDLSVPTEGKNVRTRGEYRFVDGTLRLAETSLEARAVNGTLRFTDDGVREGSIRTNFFGDQAVVSISSPRQDETLLVTHGRITAAGLAPILGKLAPHVSGAVPWQGWLRLTKGRPQVYAEADLSGLKSSLPAPLNRPEGFGSGKLVVRTELSTPDNLTLGLTSDGLFQGRFRAMRQGGWHFSGGRLIFNEAPARAAEYVPLPSARGLQLSLRLGDLNLDQWLSLLGDGASGNSPGWLVQVGADVRSLTFSDREFGRVNVALTKEQSGWSGAINGTAVEGRLRIDTTSTTRFALDLVRLRVPPLKPDAVNVASDPRKFPWVSLKAKSFQAMDKDLGELELVAQPAEHGWKIERVVLVRPEARFEANGFWRMEFGKSSSNFTMQLTSQNLGTTLTALGQPDQVDAGEVKLDARLSWAGPPTDVKFASLNGTVEVDAKKGRFLQLKQGAGRLFGLLDLSAIGRYLTLDFSTAFGRGFVFDRINGKVAIERGNAYADDFLIKGPSARIDTSGRVGLAAEDFSLTMDVYPRLSDSVTIGSFAIGGPPAGVAAWVLQKLFKKQIEQGTRVTYLINGPWSHPTITRKLVEGEKTDDQPER